MGQCIKCGMKWEAAWRVDKPYEDDPSFTLCAWCEDLQSAWRRKDKEVILYYTNRIRRYYERLALEEGPVFIGTE